MYILLCSCPLAYLKNHAVKPVTHYSRIFHPCHLVPRFTLLRFPPLSSRAEFSTPAFYAPPKYAPACIPGGLVTDSHNGKLIGNDVWPIKWHEYQWHSMSLKVTFVVTSDKTCRVVPLHLQSFLLKIIDIRQIYG